MPLNLLKKYPELLEIGHLNAGQRNTSLRGVFNRDITENPSFRFRGKPIRPTTSDGEIPMDTLFKHLTTVIVDEKTRAREFELERSVRLHWIKHHVEEKKENRMRVFSVNERGTDRTYIHDMEEKYVIVLEPKRRVDEYYLLTAYKLNTRNQKKMDNKYRKRRLPEVL